MALGIRCYTDDMSSVTLPQEQRSKILDFLRDCPDCYVGQEDDCKRSIEAVLWITRPGGQPKAHSGGWRLLPRQYGNWNGVYKRFARRCDRGVWQRMLDHFSGGPDMALLVIDSTVVRAHHSAAGASPKGDNGETVRNILTNSSRRRTTRDRRIVHTCSDS